jgi:hypothetical protein
MHPYLSAEIAAAHVADLRREAAATCCSSQVLRRSLRDRVTSLVHRDLGTECCD